MLPNILYLDGKKYVVQERPPLWRVLHEWELPESRRITPIGKPEVRPFFPNHFVKFNAGWQRLSYNMNPRFPSDKWTAMYAVDLWIANNNGFGSDDDPKANFITGKNLQYGLPSVEALTCGGNVITGYVEGDNLVVETLDGRETAPTVEWILSRPWFYTVAVRCGTNGIPRRFSQGLQPSGEVVPFLHPFICDPQRYPKITIPLWRLKKWDREELPDPFTLYSPV